MRSRSRNAMRAAVAAIALSVVAACGGGTGGGGPDSSGGEPVRGGTMAYAVNSDAQSLDAAKCGQNLNWGPCQALYGTLLNYDLESNEFTPGMAESFTSEDGTTWTLTLRAGVTFSDGTPFDAAAVVFNWDRAKDPVSASPGGSVARAMTYAVTDPRTVTVTLPQPNWQLPWAMYSELAFIGSPQAITQKGRDFANAPVGAGPFTLESWTRGTSIDFVRNANYWDQPRPYLDRFRIMIIGPDEQRANALRSGQIDGMASLVTKDAERLSGEGYSQAVLNHVGGTGVRVQMQRGPLADPDVRTAVAKLVDAQQISDAFYGGVPGVTTFAMEGSLLYDPAARYPTPDVAGAQALIDGYLARTGQSEVRLTYSLVGGIPVQDGVAQMVQAQVQRAKGIRIDIKALDAAAYLTELNAGNYDLGLASINGVNPDVLYLQFHTGSSQNTGRYSDPATDAALDRARATKDVDGQIAAYKEATRHIAANSGQISWRYQVTYVLSREGVHGVQPNLSVYVRSDQLWVEPS